ncbi:MAG: preprotein translocase subunit SecG [Clostridia bacterium]|nr:preprotein translocase subunit SecG [Clostridia bacterium]
MATAISVVLIIVALFMIVTVLLQSSEEGGISAISGQSNSYFSKSKSKTFEAKLALGTKIAASVFVVLSLLMLIVK